MAVGVTWPCPMWGKGIDDEMQRPSVQVVRELVVDS